MKILKYIDKIVSWIPGQYFLIALNLICAAVMFDGGHYYACVFNLFGASMIGYIIYFDKKLQKEIDELIEKIKNK